jgi:hypothetical protein
MGARNDGRGHRAFCKWLTSTLPHRTRSDNNLIAYFNRRHPLVFLTLNIKWFLFRPETPQTHTINILVWLHVSVFFRTSSSQYFPVKGTFSTQYTLWGSLMFITFSTRKYIHCAIYIMVSLNVYSIFH